MHGVTGQIYPTLGKALGHHATARPVADPGPLHLHRLAQSTTQPGFAIDIGDIEVRWHIEQQSPETGGRIDHAQIGP